MEWKSSSLAQWFLLVLSLNILDILITNPAYEANPVTLYLWGNLGMFLSGGIKIGQVIFFGALCLLARRVANPAEWPFVRKLLLGTLIVIATFYIFVVVWNIILNFAFHL